MSFASDSQQRCSYAVGCGGIEALSGRTGGGALLFLPLVFAPVAAGAPLFVSVDEWGKGFICDAGGAFGGGGSIMIPGCGASSITPFGSFLRLASGFSADPTPGGGAHVLTYVLPFTISTTTIDVFMSDVSSEGVFADGDTDLLRFVGNRLFFYSTQFITGTGDCSTMLPTVWVVAALGASGYKDVFAFAAIIVAMTIWPTGLFPEQRRERE